LRSNWQIALTDLALVSPGVKANWFHHTQLNGGGRKRAAEIDPPGRAEGTDEASGARARSAPRGALRQHGLCD
jgi:hypothetical protein